MRSGHIFYSLWAAAPLAMATPVLPHLVLSKTLETVSDPSSGPTGYQPPATITTAGAKGSKTEILRPLDRQAVIDDDDDMPRQPAFDNRPLSASASDLSRLASEVLSSAGPLTSDLLEALARLQSAQESLPEEAEAEAEAESDTKTQSDSHPEPSPRRKMSVGSLVRLASNQGGGVLRIKQHTETHSRDSAAALGGARQSRPCGAHHADVLVIGMVLTFLLVVLMMETAEPVSRTVRRMLKKEGAIRLKDDVETARAMSVRAPGLDIPETIDEKPEEEHDEDEDEDEDDDGGAEPWVI
ncbi:hypothetical protein INS49_001307 [Diaporthe citri]|uniref:uncharacterized protein n=1 Tax=Diaporthe citri TaxID=83186 RepID=UPI001C7F5F50|nr:uncharacterized protein INS49_001307 [Diaporthe citri]KAG6367125.1 hypothetical protein INS49_001307 [Diaporthe citri]